MVFGFPYGCPYGSHEAIIVWAGLTPITKYNPKTQLDEETGEYVLQWIVGDECSMYFRIAVAGYKTGAPIYCVAGVLNQKIISIPDGEHLVSICPQGQFGDSAVRIQDQIEAFYEDGRHFPNHIQTIIRAPISTLVVGTSQLSGLSVTGMLRGVNLAPVADRPTWGVLDLALSTLGGVHTIIGSVNGQPMMTGSRTGDGTIILSGAGAQIIATLTYTGDYSTGVQLICRWPQEYRIYVAARAFGQPPVFALPTFDGGIGGESGDNEINVIDPFVFTDAFFIQIDAEIILVTAVDSGVNATVIRGQRGTTIAAHADCSTATLANDFPANPTAVLQDDGHSNSYVFKSRAMTGGDKHVVIHAVGDDLIESTDPQGGGTLVTVYAVPDPVTNLRYISGGADATMIGWTGPVSDPTVTFNYYDSLDTGILTLLTPTGTTGMSVSTLVLADISGFTGERFVVVRSVKDGVEDPSLTEIVIEYEMGIPVPLRPMAAAAGQHFQTSALTLTVPVSVTIDPALAYPASIELYIYPVGSAPDYENPNGTIAVPANTANVHTMMIGGGLQRNAKGAVITNGAGQPILAGLSGAVLTAGAYYFEVGTSGADVLVVDEVGDPVLDSITGLPIYWTGAKTLTGQVYGPVILTDTAFSEPTFTADGA